MAEGGEETRVQGGEEPPMASEKNNGETNGAMPPAAAAAGEAGEASVVPPVAINIWPPSKRTRDAVIQRLVLNLSTESILSKRYPLLPPVEASEAAHRIEEEAFATASAASDVSSANLDDGIATLQIYSREISKRMIETVKAKAASASASGSAPAAPPSSSNGSGVVENPPPTGAGEESSGSSPA